MAGETRDPLKHPEVRQATASRYITGFITSVVLMGAALLLAKRHDMPNIELSEAVAAIGLLALFSQAALFFGLDLSRAQIWKGVSLVLTIPLFILSVGLTVWMFDTLYARTMLPMPQMSLTQPTLLQ